MRRRRFPVVAVLVALTLPTLLRGGAVDQETVYYMGDHCSDGSEVPVAGQTRIRWRETASDVGGGGGGVSLSLAGVPVPSAVPGAASTPCAVLLTSATALTVQLVALRGSTSRTQLTVVDAWGNVRELAWPNQPLWRSAADATLTPPLWLSVLSDGDNAGLEFDVIVAGMLPNRAGDGHACGLRLAPGSVQTVFFFEPCVRLTMCVAGVVAHAAMDVTPPVLQFPVLSQDDGFGRAGKGFTHR